MSDAHRDEAVGREHRVGAVIDRLVIDAMSHGPDAVARDRGRVVFVAAAAPGDVADVTLTHAQPRFSRARVLKLHRPSPLRREPPCPYAGRCGGCQWQHLTYPAQLEAKQRNLVDHLVRIGGLQDPPVLQVLRSPDEWRYRHRINLRVDGRRLGFYRAASHELVEIDECRIAAAPVETGLAAARRWLASIETTLRRLSVVVSEDVPGIVLVANAEGPFAPADDVLNRRAAAPGSRSIRGIVMFGKRWRRTWGDVEITFTVDGACLTASGGEFTQVSFPANRLLVETVLNLAKVSESEEAIDLYCGAGNLSVPLARRGARVLGVERSARAIADAEANVRRLGLANCHFRCARVETAVADLVAQRLRPRVVILDPPRGGAGGILGDVVRLRPERLVYVSCDPPTLARDLAALRQHGCRLETVQPIDIFPHTYHLEVVSVLTGP